MAAKGGDMSVGLCCQRGIARCNVLQLHGNPCIIAQAFKGLPNLCHPGASGSITLEH